MTILDCLQAWGEAFYPRRHLYPHIWETYHKLKIFYMIPFPRPDFDPTRVPIFLGPLRVKDYQAAIAYRDSMPPDHDDVSNDRQNIQFHIETEEWKCPPTSLLDMQEQYVSSTLHEVEKSSILSEELKEEESLGRTAVADWLDLPTRPAPPLPTRMNVIINEDCLGYSRSIPALSSPESNKSLIKGSDDVSTKSTKVNEICPVEDDRKKGNDSSWDDVFVGMEGETLNENYAPAVMSDPSLSAKKAAIRGKTYIPPSSDSSVEVKYFGHQRVVIRKNG